MRQYLINTINLYFAILGIFNRLTIENMQFVTKL